MPDKATYMSAVLLCLKRPTRGRKLICISNKAFLLLMVRSMQISTHVFKQQTHRVVNEKEVNVSSKNLNN